jgi:hypothetical protein
VLTRIARFAAFDYAVTTQLRAWTIRAVWVRANGSDSASASTVGGQLTHARAVAAGLGLPVNNAVIHGGVAVADAASVDGGTVVELDRSADKDSWRHSVTLAVKQIKVVVVAHGETKLCSTISQGSGAAIRRPRFVNVHATEINPQKSIDVKQNIIISNERK